MEPTVTITEDWIVRNKNQFLPPVCNKMLHDTQLKVFYVGGPNTRKDFHIEEGEEFFYMRKGDMNLIVLANGNFQDVIIKEGEVFLLPARIPHSPQRFENTVGIVVERERKLNEKDCLRYYVEGTTESLFERWFYCENLGVQLGPVIKEYFASEQHKTGRPIPGTIPTDPPFVPDAERIIEKPFNLKLWIQNNRKELTRLGKKRLFDETYQTEVVIYGRGEHQSINTTETFVSQLEGITTFHMNSKTYILKSDETMLIPSNVKYIAIGSDDCVSLHINMDPNKIPKSEQ